MEEIIMQILVSLLPLLLWSVLFVVLLKKYGFEKIIFIICLAISVLLYISSAILTSTLSASILINIVGQTLFLYIIIDFVYNLAKRKKDSKLSKR